MCRPVCLRLLCESLFCFAVCNFCLVFCWNFWFQCLLLSSCWHFGGSTFTEMCDGSLQWSWVRLWLCIDWNLVHENCFCLSCILQTEDKVGLHDWDTDILPASACYWFHTHLIPHTEEHMSYTTPYAVVEYKLRVQLFWKCTFKMNHVLIIVFTFAFGDFSSF